MRLWTARRRAARRMRWARIGLPALALLAAGALLATAAGYPMTAGSVPAPSNKGGSLPVPGYAVGPLLAGGVWGETGVTVSPALVLSPQGSHGHQVKRVDSHDLYKGSWVITVDPQQTRFRAAIEAVVGRPLTLGLSIENRSTATGTPVHGELRLVAPPGMQVEVRGNKALYNRLARLDDDTWLFTAPGEESRYDPRVPDILITFRTSAGAPPGVYPIIVTIQHVEY